jgi:hypothetical protein
MPPTREGNDVPWNTLWTGLKDVLLTGTGMALILSQIFSRSPSDVLLVTGLALTVPSVAGHAGALLSGRPGDGGRHSPSLPPGGPQPLPQPSQEATGEPAQPSP